MNRLPDTRKNVSNAHRSSAHPVIQLSFIVFIRFYQSVISPWLGMRCRFEPTCSHYASEAITTHGMIRGGWLTAWRLLRCAPWGGHGHDPVPPLKDPSLKGQI